MEDKLKEYFEGAELKIAQDIYKVYQASNKEKTTQK